MALELQPDLPEARLAREAELPYALIGMVTDYDCWRRPPAPTGSASASDSMITINKVRVRIEILLF